MIALAIAPATAPGHVDALEVVGLPLGPRGTWRRWLDAVHREDGEDVADPVDDGEGGGKRLRLRLGDALGDDLLDLGLAERELGRHGIDAGRRRRAAPERAAAAAAADFRRRRRRRTTVTRAAMAVKARLRLISASGSRPRRGRGSPGIRAAGRHWDRAPPGRRG